MKTFAALLVGLALLSSVVGCCCSHGACSPYGAACPPGGPCGAAPGGYPLGVAPQGMYQNVNSVQANYPGTAATPIYGTAAYPGGYSQTALAPLEPLPTY